MTLYHVGINNAQSCIFVSLLTFVAASNCDNFLKQNFSDVSSMYV